MARPRKSASQPSYTSAQAKYVLERLIKDRRVSQSDVRGYVNEIQSEIGALEERLRALRETAGEGIRSAVQALTPGPRRGRPPGSAKAPGAKRARRRAKITPEQLASRQLQGRYLGLIRQIPASRRGQYQKTAKERGREAAIKEMSAVLHK